MNTTTIVVDLAKSPQGPRGEAGGYVNYLEKADYLRSGKITMNPLQCSGIVRTSSSFGQRNSLFNRRCSSVVSDRRVVGRFRCCGLSNGSR